MSSWNFREIYSLCLYLKHKKINSENPTDESTIRGIIYTACWESNGNRSPCAPAYICHSAEMNRKTKGN